MKRIALFNHKGGVSKTTTTFNLGWMLASKGKRVIMVDADPQCNLTGLVLGADRFSTFYEEANPQNIKDSVSPVFKGRLKLIQPVECQQVKGMEGLFLLPGHLELAEYEVKLGFAQQLSASSLFSLQNIPGAFSYLLKITAKKYSADYVIIDMNSSLSSINQNLLMTSDYFIIPTAPDYFSIMALESMIKTLTGWKQWAEQAATLSILSEEEAAYPFPKVTPKFLGILVQRYLEEFASEIVQQWIDKIKIIVKEKFIPAMISHDLILPASCYENDYCLAEIKDFRSLVALSQTHQIPIFEFGSNSVASPTQRDLAKKLYRVFSTLTDKIIKLTTDENCT
jgi:cellulose biosynthesis protein BcsQ